MSLNIPDMSTPSVDLPDVSQTFNLQAQHHPPHNVPQDLILFSKKSGVIFYTHRNLLLDKSNNSFGKLLSHEAIEGMKSESANGILHTLLVTETTEIIDCLLRLLYVSTIVSIILRNSIMDIIYGKSSTNKGHVHKRAWPINRVPRSSIRYTVEIWLYIGHSHISIIRTFCIPPTSC